MQIHKGNSYGSICSSSHGVKIKLQHKSSQKCRTELSDEFWRIGESVTWAGKQLGSCEKIKIDVTTPTIALWIMQDQNGTFCPISVTVTLKDTSFHLSFPEGGEHDLATNVDQYIAFNKAGKFA